MIGQALGLIAAIAKTHGRAVATRDTAPPRRGWRSSIPGSKG
ncbi:type II toxin-antitoxin system VapC family toxin [Pelomicrobium methylotrophicum]|uniref:Type II toxin-antitoxin system VapC family toxin n=1 Tax=Pelomicrobium methylotrophicum TaxID=2602750 RepID=A0A5C7EGY4_9PROT|nr:type II toxin-antitoxin system VapC family toxin [Pelomicrobium methylotrophicum]TXF10580.1 type II toxin-antitoxin system VapC family toxin [Pelomicrobium methylotrophicum]